MDDSQWTFPQALQAAGYQTALFGKWHLGHGPGHNPKGFDVWPVLPGQGRYHNPVMLEQGRDGATPNTVERWGYVTDLITDDCLRFLDELDHDRPFALFCLHKAPHRHWDPTGHTPGCTRTCRFASRSPFGTISPASPEWCAPCAWG